MSTSSENPESAQLAARLRELNEKIIRLEMLNRHSADEVLTLRQNITDRNAANDREPVKVPPPRKYDGSQKNLKAFIMQCRLYFEHQEPHLEDEDKKVLTAIAYLDGPAADWAQPFLDEYLLKKNNPDERNAATQHLFLTMSNFFDILKQTFGDPDMDREYERKLLRLRQTKSASIYTNEFRMLMSHLDWDDEPAMARYYEGLKDNVKDEISKTMRPAKLNEYCAMAIAIDNRLYERMLERKGRSTERFFQPKYKGKSNWNQRPTDQGDPMELDTSHVDDIQRRKFTGKCYNCGKVGHYARDCRSKVPETKYTKVMQVDHKSLSWTACYDDNCTTHYSDKNESGWFPRAPKTKNVKQMRHSFAHDSEDYDSEPDEHTTSLAIRQAPALDKYTQDTQDDSGNGGVRLPQGADLD